MKLGVFAKGLAIASVAAFTLAACSSGDPEDSPSGDSTAPAGTAIILANGSEPQNPLIPGATNETGGGKIIDSIFSMLVYYDATGAVHNEVAESIVTDDPTHLTVTLNDGWTFTDGTPVTASSFVDAWNYTANIDNAYYNQYFFEDVEGFSWDESTPELSGLEVVDDLTFTIALNKPASDFATRLGYSGFAPLPEAFFADPEAYGENPIGNGPYMLAGDGAWQHDIQIDLVANPDYQGDRAPKNDGVTFVFYETQDAAYADLLADNVDVIDGIPDSAYATFETDLGDRAVNQPAAIFQAMTIAQWQAHFMGEEGKLRRAAISMSINREEITDVIFQGTRTPASDFTSPVIDGWSNTLAGAEVLAYNPEKAAELWAEADAISPWDGKFLISYNADGGHQGWVDAVANSVKNTLGIEAEGNPFAVFGDYRAAVTDTANPIQTAFRAGWQADYPGLYNFLGPLYATNAGSNDGHYTSEEFDALLAEGITQTDSAAANALFQEAQEVLLVDLPVLPLWYSNVTGGYSSKVSDVEFGWNSVPLYYNITK